MYAQMVKTGADRVRSREELPAQERAFQDRVDAERDHARDLRKHERT